MSIELQFPILSELGLSLNEAKIYELLLKKGPTKPPDLVKGSGILRANVYHILDVLRAKGLVTKYEGKNMIYEATDPSALRQMLDVKMKESALLKQSFENELPFLKSTFQLSTGKPAIEIFEGLEGIENILEDSLNAKSEILTITDIDAITEEIEKLENAYIAKRKAKKRSKRVLLPNVPSAQEVLIQDDFTKTKIAKNLNGGFKSAMEIYDDTVSLITLGGDRVISVLIKNKSLAALQRSMFEGLWSNNN